MDPKLMGNARMRNVECRSTSSQRTVDMEQSGQGIQPADPLVVPIPHSAFPIPHSPLRILGIDPGLNLTGYAVLEAAQTGPKVFEAGLVRGKSKVSIAAALAPRREPL